jgi:hypothetical protein
MDETVEEDVIEEIKEEVIHEPIFEPVENNVNDTAVASGTPKPSVSFNNIDYIKTDEGISQINAPKSLDRLEEISVIRNEQRKRDSEEEDEQNIKLQILDEDFKLDNLDIHNIEEPKLDLLPDLLIDEIEVLE